MTPRLCLLVSVGLYALSLVLPVGQDEGPPRFGFEYLVLGGYLCAGVGLVPANLLAWVGWGCLAGGRRGWTLALASSALLFGAVGVVPLALACAVLAYPAFWVWVGSFAVLAAGGLLLPRTGTTTDLGP